MKNVWQIGLQIVRSVVVISLIILIARPVEPVHAATEIFVSESGSGTDCIRTKPCALSYGLTKVLAGDSLIAGEGLYTTGSGTAHELVLLDKDIDFLGGWDGGTSGAINRDPSSHPSVLDAKGVMRVITIEGGATFTPLVDGWTITGGNATGIVGAGHECTNWYWADISGCGGGIYINGAQPTISNNLIFGNVAADATAASDGAGGGIYLINSAGTFIVYNEIYNNDARINGEGNGGGIFMNDSGGKTSVIRNLIYGNEGSSSTTHSGLGMGIFVASNIDQVQIYDNDFFGNNPDEWNSHGVAFLCQYCTETVLVDENNIHDNFGASAIVLSFSNTTIQQNIIINPEMTYGISVFATQYTGVPQPPASILNNIIADHTTANIYINGGPSAEVFSVFAHNTLVNSDYGLFVDLYEPGLVSFYGGIVSDAGITGIYQEVGSTTDPAVSYTLFHNNAANGDVGDHALYGDPRFVDPLVNDYHIQGTSAAINTVPDGGLYEDIDDDDRPSGWGATPFDAGADEFIWLYGLFLPLARK